MRADAAQHANAARRGGVGVARSWSAVAAKEQAGGLCPVADADAGVASRKAQRGPAAPSTADCCVEDGAGIGETPAPVFHHPRGGAATGSAPVVGYAAWKTAISAAADWRETAAAGAVGAS